MNFDAFWQANRRFVTGVAIGLVLFLIGEGIIGSMARTALRSSERQVGRHRATLRKRAPGSKAVDRMETRLRELRAREAALSRAALPVRRNPFEVGNGDASQLYIDTVGRLRNELVPWAFRADLDVEEDLGLPPVSPTRPEEIQQVLHGLDVVERIVRLAVAAGAHSVEGIDITTRRRRANRKGPQLQLTPVSMTVVLDEGRELAFVDAVLHPEASCDPPVDSLGLVRLHVGPPDKRLRRSVQLEFEVGTLPERTEEAR